MPRLRERAWRKAARPVVRTEAVDAPEAPAGEPAGPTLRYLAFYSKRGKARYLSHIDLIHIIQRSFRRAGIEVRKTQGFHPKMDFAYGPALPLGMEAIREVLEFRSDRRIEPRDFLVRVNRSVPPGIRFSGLTVLEAGTPSLHKLLDELIYSLDRKSEALGPTRGARELRLALARFKVARAGAAADRSISPAGALVLALPPDPAQGSRVQDIVREVFGVEEPVFLIRRDGSP